MKLKPSQRENIVIIQKSIIRQESINQSIIHICLDYFVCLCARHIVDRTPSTYNVISYHRLLSLCSLSAFLCILLCKFLLTMRTEAISHTCARLFVHHFDEECLFGAFWLRYKCCCHSSDGLCRCENSLVEHEPLIDATKSISSTYFRFFPFISISSAHNSF